MTHDDSSVNNRNGGISHFETMLEFACYTFKRDDLAFKHLYVDQMVHCEVRNMLNGAALSLVFAT